MSKNNTFFTKDYLNLPYCEVGDYTYGKPEVVKWGAEGKIRIGKFNSIAEKVMFLLGSEHRIDWVTTYPFTSIKMQKQLNWFKGQKYEISKGDIILENDIWVGYDTTILSGVTISNGAVIGAKSVVAKNIPPYAIAVGNPAKIIRYRFSEIIISKLLKIKWWDWDIKKIKDNIELMKDINKFVETHF